MRIVGSAEVDAALSYPRLVDVLEAMFRAGAIAPTRHHHTIELEGRPEATLLLMPAWTRARSGADAAGRYAGVKSVTVFPDAGRVGKPAVQGIYLLFDTESGAPLALIDAPALTAWRTAAASALAARHLARADAHRMLMVGAGALAPFLVHAHASVRPIREVAVWNRTRARAEALVRRLSADGFAARVAGDLASEVGRADLVSTATIASEALVHGDWLSPGTHLDCVGAFRPTMRETDDEVARRARIWVDTRAGALKEAGDIRRPLDAGVIEEADILGDLFDLARGAAPVRDTADEITMFKSVGAALEDLAAAIEVWERVGRGGSSSGAGSGPG